jgi:hypothetical protein
MALTCRICFEDEPFELLQHACACRGDGDAIHIGCAARSCVGQQEVVCSVCRQRFALPIAERVYREVISREAEEVPEEVRTGFHIQLGEILARQGRDDEAWAEVQPASHRTSDVVLKGRAWRIMAKVCTRKGRFAVASRHLDDASYCEKVDV